MGVEDQGKQCAGAEQQKSKVHRAPLVCTVRSVGSAKSAFDQEGAGLT
jgi:hypothetical protein